MSHQDAIDCFHGLLNDQKALDAQSQLNALLKERHLYFGERPICTVLRPHFYTPEQWAFLKAATEIIIGAFGKAHLACLHDPAIRAQLALEHYEEALFHLDKFYTAPWSSSRLDSFYDPLSGTLRYIEYNGETPAGMTYEDQLAEAFSLLPLFVEFQQYYTVESLPLTVHLLGALRATYREWGGTGNPNIAIVDWSDVPTLNEHQLCRDYFVAHDCPTVLADPRSLEYRHGALYAGAFKIDFIYKRVLLNELIDRMGMENPIVHALRDRAVCMSNAFSAKLMAKKASFALISDEQNAHLFTPEERHAIESYIPWTRRVEERNTEYHGHTVDLLPFVADHRENLVLKPNDSYGGKGVVIGWETTPEAWTAAIQSALTSSYVVQERVHVGEEDYPSIVNGRLDISSRLLDADPYIFQGARVAGCLTRLSSVALLNVTAGGGSAVPTFLIRKRE
jgi:hypothetical protein